MSETKTKEKKGFILRALDTVERVGNGLPNPATIFIILTAAVIVISAICAACGVSVTYDFLDSKTGEINQMSVAVVSLLAPDSIRHMVTTVVSNFTGFFALGTVFTIMIGVGVADGTGFLSALLRKVAASTSKGLVTSVVVFLGIIFHRLRRTGSARCDSVYGIWPSSDCRSRCCIRRCIWWMECKPSDCNKRPDVCRYVHTGSSDTGSELYGFTGCKLVLHDCIYVPHYSHRNAGNR